MSKFVWNRTVIEALIRQWKKYQNLYDCRHKDFENIIKRNESLAQIFLALKKFDEEDVLTIDEVKKRIHILRIQYSREFLRHENTCRRNNQSVDDFYLPKLWCYEQLNFLRPDYESELIPTTSKANKKESYIVKESAIPVTKRIRREQISTDLQNQLATVEHLLENRAVNNYKWLGKQVTFQMDEIEDDAIQEEASCAIQRILRANVKSEQQISFEKQNELDSASSNSSGFGFSNDFQNSTVEMKMELNENSDDSIEYSNYLEPDEAVVNMNLKNTTNEEVCFDDDDAVEHNPLSPPRKEKSAEFEIDDFTLDIENDIYVPKMQYVKEAIKDSSSSKQISKRLIALHEEKTKAETIYFRKKAAYFQKQTDNLETQRKLMILQAQKLRLEIEKLRNDF